MPDMPLTSEPWAAVLAGVAVTIGDIPPEARAVARRALIDITGCMIAGVADDAAQTVRKVCGAWGAGPATVVGATVGQSPPWAALVNGTAAHALDFDDNFDPAKAHISAVLFPALLALAETRQLPGRAVIDSYVVGTEIAACLGRALNPRHRDSGWHATSTIGPIAAAGACGHLIGLDAARIAHAINAASSFAGGTVAQFGTMMKAVHAGRAAAAGVMAASFAEAGLTAGMDALDGVDGLGSLMAGQNAPLKNGATLALLRDGLKVKLYPCCASAHRAIDAVLKLRDVHALTVEMIARIDVHLPLSHLNNLMYPEPDSPREARFSLGYCVAAAVHGGGLSLTDFTAEAFARRERQATSASVRAHAEDISETASPTKVVITTKDGRVLRETVDAPRGRADNPLSDADLWSKFRDCCAGHIATERRENVVAALGAFDSDAPATQLMTLLRP